MKDGRLDALYCPVKTLAEVSTMLNQAFILDRQDSTLMQEETPRANSIDKRQTPQCEYQFQEVSS